MVQKRECLWAVSSTRIQQLSCMYRDRSLHQQANPAPACFPPLAGHPVLLEPRPPFPRERCSGTSPTTALHQAPSAPTLVPAPVTLSARSDRKAGFSSAFAQTVPRAQKWFFPLWGPCLLHETYRSHHVNMYKSLFRWRKTYRVTTGPQGDIYYLTVSAEGCIFYGKSSKDVN